MLILDFAVIDEELNDCSSLRFLGKHIQSLFLLGYLTQV